MFHHKNRNKISFEGPFASVSQQQFIAENSSAPQDLNQILAHKNEGICYHNDSLMLWHCKFLLTEFIMQIDKTFEIIKSVLHKLLNVDYLNSFLGKNSYFNISIFSRTFLGKHCMNLIQKLKRINYNAMIPISRIMFKVVSKIFVKLTT